MSAKTLKTEFPSVQEELERKAVETIAELMQRYEQQEISADRYKHSLSVVWSIVSGLIDDEVCTSLADSIDQINAKDIERVLLRNDGRVYLVEFDFIDGIGYITDLVRGERRKLNELMNNQEAFEKFSNTVSALKSRGFEEV